MSSLALLQIIIANSRTKAILILKYKVIIKLSKIFYVEEK